MHIKDVLQLNINNSITKNNAPLRQGEFSLTCFLTSLVSWLQSHQTHNGLTEAVITALG